MLTINDTPYNANDFEQYFQHFATMSSLANSQNIAVCLTDQIQWLALCLYAKQQQLSVMPIHSSIPLHTAKTLAAKAGCSMLLYQDLDNPISVDTQQPTQQASGLIQMSSGTTGEPKCIKRSWQSIDVEVASYIKTFSQAQDKTPVIACPITHSYGLICGVMVALARGQQPIVITNINPKYLIKKLLSITKPLLYSSPTMLEGLMRLWPKNSRLHGAMTSGTIMSGPLFDLLSARVENLYQQYGCSETGCISISQHLHSANDLGTPLPHITVLGSFNSQNPAEFIANLTINGHTQTIHTQDLGYLERNHHGDMQLRFLARLDDTIIVAGQNVYPQEIEDIVLTHPQIQDAVVFKIDDLFAGQRVCLHFQSTAQIDTQQIRKWCREQLATYQIPQFVHQVDTIERLANGKVNRKKIAAAYQQVLKTSDIKSA